MRLARIPEGARRNPHRALSLGERRDDRVVEVADEDVVRTLVGENSELRFGVLVHRVVAVEMVRLDVEQHGDARLERTDPFELERRDFGDDPIVGAGLHCFRDQRVTDVAADARRAAGIAEDVPDQRGGRRLALGAGDRDDRRASQTIGDLDLAIDGDVSALHEPHERVVERNARREDRAGQRAGDRRAGPAAQRTPHRSARLRRSRRATPADPFRRSHRRSRRASAGLRSSRRPLRPRPMTRMRSCASNPPGCPFIVCAPAPIMVSAIPDRARRRQTNTSRSSPKRVGYPRLRPTGEVRSGDAADSFGRCVSRWI